MPIEVIEPGIMIDVMASTTHNMLISIVWLLIYCYLFVSSLITRAFRVKHCFRICTISIGAINLSLDARLLKTWRCIKKLQKHYDIEIHYLVYLIKPDIFSFQLNEQVQSNNVKVTSPLTSPLNTPKKTIADLLQQNQ